MPVPGIQSDIKVNLPNAVMPAGRNFGFGNNPKPNEVRVQQQEDNFNGKRINNKNAIAYTAAGTILASITGIFLDFKFAKGKHIKELWNKFTGNINLFKSKNPLEKCVQECRGLTFDSSKLKLIKDFYGDKNKYDLGLRYAIVARNTKKAKGSGVIIQEIPEMFKGLDIDALTKALDDLRFQNIPWGKDKFYRLNIGERSFRVTYAGEGSMNKVYKITDESGKSLCYRYAKYPLSSCTGHGICDETAIAIEANKAGVTDVNKLYMANILAEKFVTEEERVVYSGGWQLSEFIDGTRSPQKGLKLLDWLKSKGLRHNDIERREAANMVNGFIIDMGGIVPRVKDDPADHFVHINWNELNKYLG